MVRLAVTTTEWFIINQYFTIEYLCPATCFGFIGSSSGSDIRTRLGQWIANMDPYLVQLVVLYGPELCLELNIIIEIKYTKI
jgi:hypothetical protein